MPSVSSIWNAIEPGGGTVATRWPRYSIAIGSRQVGSTAARSASVSQPPAASTAAATARAIGPR